MDGHGLGPWGRCVGCFGSHLGTPAGVAFLGVVHNPLGAFLQYLEMVIYDGIRMYDGISWDVHGCTYSMMFEK